MRLIRSSAAALAVLGMALPAAAQEEDSGRRLLEEITVTAAYREQGLSDVPVSVSAVTGDALIETSVQKAEDLQFLVPNFNVTETGISTNVFIRGIGSGINQAFEQSVGTYIDGVSFGRAQMFRSPFLDLERVEVLRGPQSILFGKNSVAGALNITTAKPTEELQGRLFVAQEFEDEETIVEGMLSGPITDRLRGRVAVRYRNALGYVENATLNGDEPARDDMTIRGILEMDVADNLTATLKLESSEFDVYGRQIEIINEQPASVGPFAGSGLRYNDILQAFFGADSSVDNVVQDYIRSSNGDFSFNESDSAILTLDWELGEHTLQSITAYVDFAYDELCDCDFTGATVFDAALQETYEQFSQEIRLSSPLRENFDYILGLYYQTSDHEFQDQILVPANSVLVPAINQQAAGFGNLVANTQAARIASVDSDVLSAFAQVNWHVSETFTAQIGGRITEDERDGFRTLSIQSLGGAALPAPQAPAPLVYANVFGITSTNLAALGPTGAALIGALGELPVSGNRSTTKFSPELKGIWDIGDDAMVYLSWAEGFKSGSYDFRANNRSFYPTLAESFEFDDEEATNIELGSKLVLGDGIAELNVAYFVTDYKELQISIFDGVLGFNVGNAASAEINGLEIDGRIAAADFLTISGGLAFTDFEFDDFRNGQCYFGQTPNVDLDGDMTPELCDYTGNSNQMLSDFQGNVTFDFEFPIANDLDLGIRLDVFHTSEYDASATYDPALVQDSYTKFDARVAVRADRWEVALLGKNLSDEQVLLFGGDTPLAGSSFGAKSNYSFFGQGRTLTLQGSVSF